MRRRGIGFADHLPIRLIAGIAAIAIAGQISLAAGEEAKRAPVPMTQ